MVNGGIQRQSIKIGVKFRFSFKVLDGAEQFDKDILNDIEGILPLPHHPIGDPIDFLMILVEDLLKCILIPLLTSGD